MLTKNTQPWNTEGTISMAYLSSSLPEENKTWLGYLVSQLLFDVTSHMHEKEKMAVWTEYHVVKYVQPTTKFQRYFKNT
jgi:hypothetical protein